MGQSSNNNNTNYDLQYTFNNLTVVVKESNKDLRCGFKKLTVVVKESNKDLSGGLNNLTVVMEINKVKQTHDDYDGAEPSEERSTDDVPNPKRIERITEFMDQGEELSTWTVLSQSF